MSRRCGPRSRAAAGDPTRPRLPARVAAGLAAKDARAFAEAHRHYERALELWERVADRDQVAGLDRVDLLAHSAEAAALAGTTDHAIALLEQALEQLNPTVEPVRAGVLLGQPGDHRHTALDQAAALANYAEAERLLATATPSAETARVLTEHAHVLQVVGRPRGAIAPLEHDYREPGWEPS